MTNGEGKVHVAFLMGKTRVTPLKKQTIPRLELAAATLSVKVDRMLKELLSPTSMSVFWSDSTSVLKYISNDNTRFHTYGGLNGDILTLRKTLLMSAPDV